MSGGPKHVYCIYCGTIVDNASYCPECGSRVNSIPSRESHSTDFYMTSQLSEEPIEIITPVCSSTIASELEHIYCIYCGTIVDSASYCSECGSRINSISSRESHSADLNMTSQLSEEPIEITTPVCSSTIASELEHVYCIYCGTIVDNASYCPECGSRVNSIPSRESHSADLNMTSQLSEEPTEITVPVFLSTKVTSEDLCKLEDLMSRLLKKAQEDSNPIKNAKIMIGTEGNRHKKITYADIDGKTYSIGSAKTECAFERYKDEQYFGIKNTFDNIIYEEETDDYLNDPYSYQR